MSTTNVDMTDRDVIEAMGDTSALARALGIDRRVVSNWKTRGISAAGRYKVAEAAKRKRFRLPANFMTRKG